jgi:hypothetical protein
MRAKVRYSIPRWMPVRASIFLDEEIPAEMMEPEFNWNF